MRSTNKRRRYAFGKYKGEVTLLALVLLVGSGVFMFFKSFFDNDISNLTTEILAALLGSIITVIITMLLIRQQGTVEQVQETTAASKTIVFQEKLKLFREFIEVYTKSSLDGKLSREELENLEVLAMTISILARRIPIRSSEPTVDREGEKFVDLSKGLGRFVLQLQLFGLDTKGVQLVGDKRQLHQEYFGEYQEGEYRHLAFQDKELLSIEDILAMMKTELVMAQWDSLEMDDDLLEGTRYSEVRKLLTYRDYRDQ
ncbi:MAG: hypothetical protein OXF79_30780 [Chloroflexi bacterium]|nr:hypothetical protein [Chloroflexota bacterium]